MNRELIVKKERREVRRFVTLLLGLAGVCWISACQRSGGRDNSSAVASSAADQANYGSEVSRLVYDKDEIVSVLKNGMVVIARRVPSPVVSVRGYVMAGGIYEGKWLGGGLSHLLEHLVAGGSNERRTEEQNRNLLQQIGNNSNAFTSSEQTAFFVNTTAANLEPAVDLVTGWLLGAKITPAEYGREYEVVQRELEKDNGEPEWVFYYQTQRNRYLVSPVRVPVIGYQEVIRGLTRDDVYAYYKLAYVPNNMIFTVTGNLDPEAMLRAVQKHVADAPPGRAFSHSIEEEPPLTSPRTLVSTFPKLGQAKLELAFPSVKISSSDVYALDLLATVLTKGESSLLVEEIRDKRSLVSEIAASDFTPNYVEGTFTIDMELPPDKLAEASAAVLEQLEKIKKEGVSEDRLSRAKTQTRTARAFAQQTAGDVGNSLASDFMSTGDPHFSDRYVERIQKVTVQQIKDVASRYFDRTRLLTTAMLPQESVPKGGLAEAERMLRAVSGAPKETAVAAQQAQQITKVELKDGTTMLLKRVQTAPTVVMTMYSLGGLTVEDAASNGLGNLAMQLVSRGTKTRSAQQIGEFFDSVGGEFAATSADNYWSWSAICLKDDLGKTLDVFADLVENPSFPDGEIGPVRKRIAAAIDSQDADWFAASRRFFRQSYFGPLGSPYQFAPIGTKANLEKFTPEEIRRWYAEKVLHGRRVLAIFGDIDVEQAKSLAEARLGKLPPAPANAKSNAGVSGAKKKDSDKPSVLVTRVQTNKTSNPQAGVIIGFDSRSVVGQADNVPLTVADTMASGYGYPTGYIFEILRGRGLVYDANAYIFPGRDQNLPGAFIVYAGCDPKNVNEVIDVILENIARLQGQPRDMQPDWFARAKQLIVTADALDNETAIAQAKTAALDELYGVGYDYHTHFADRISSVEITDVQAAARRLLRQCVVTVTTSAPEAVGIKPGERRYDSFPAVDLTPRGVQHDSK
jgi:zinc protease